MDIVDRVNAAIHLESAAIAPQTSALIETARCAAAEIERLRAALTKLSNEVFGLCAFEVGVRHAISSTNFNVLMQRAHEARAALK